jgi:hypothetical protein
MSGRRILRSRRYEMPSGLAVAAYSKSASCDTEGIAELVPEPRRSVFRGPDATGRSHKRCLIWTVKQWSRFDGGAQDLIVTPPLNVPQPPTEGSCHANTPRAVLC